MKRFAFFFNFTILISFKCSIRKELAKDNIKMENLLALSHWATFAVDHSAHQPSGRQIKSPSKHSKWLDGSPAWRNDAFVVLSRPASPSHSPISHLQAKNDKYDNLLHRRSLKFLMISKQNGIISMRKIQNGSKQDYNMRWETTV